MKLKFKACLKLIQLIGDMSKEDGGLIGICRKSKQKNDIRKFLHLRIYNFTAGFVKTYFGWTMQI